MLIFFPEFLLFGSFWTGPNNVDTVLYCHGDECQKCRQYEVIKVTFRSRRVTRFWPFAPLHWYATVIKRSWLHPILAQPTNGSNCIVNLWHFCNKLHKSSRQFQNKWPVFSFIPKRACSEPFPGFSFSLHHKEQYLFFSHYSLMLLEKHCSLIFREL